MISLFSSKIQSEGAVIGSLIRVSLFRCLHLNTFLAWINFHLTPDLWSSAQPNLNPSSGLPYFRAEHHRHHPPPPPHITRNSTECWAGLLVCCQCCSSPAPSQNIGFPQPVPSCPHTNVNRVLTLKDWMCRMDDKTFLTHQAVGEHG